MNIGIDARILERRMTGIGRFLKTVLDELPAVDKENRYFLFTYGRYTINENFYTGIPTIKSFLPQKLFSPLWNNLILPRYLKKNKIDLFFSVNQQIPLFRIKNVKYILALHDVIYKVNKNFHPLVYRKYLQFFSYFSVKLSDLIITVSEYSKRDILKYYKVDENKIKVVYEAADQGFKPLNLTGREKNELKEKLKLPEHVILYVGMIENRKNISGILQIADEVYEKNKEIKFVLIGKIGYGGESLMREILKRKNIVYLTNVDDKLLKQMYNISSVFLFPSFYEGFGFPPLEAMQSGLPVVASENTSLKEIIDKGGLLHDADDLPSFVKDIFELIEDPELYREVRNKGLEQARKFNINTTVKELVSAFNSVM